MWCRQNRSSLERANRRAARSTLPHPSAVFSVCFSPTSPTVLSGDQAGGSPGLWDVASGRLLRETAAGHGAAFNIAASRQGDFAVCFADGTVARWRADGTEAAVLGQHEQQAFAVAFSPDGGPDC